SDYAANIEMAEVVCSDDKPSVEEKTLEKVETINQKTIEQVSSFLNVSPRECIKSLVLKVDDEFVMVLVRGDHEVNDIKVKNVLNASLVECEDEFEVEELLGCSFGSIGPVGLPETIKVYADNAVQAMINATCSANENNNHYINVVPNRDFSVESYADFRFIQEGDPSPDGQGTIRFARGIEVGHIFKLGTKYSDSMDAKFLDENGRAQSYIMGCYGIGISRTLTAVAEQCNDDNGLVWPVDLAPYHIHLISVNVKDD